MTTDRKIPEGHFYEVPLDVTPEKLVHILYTGIEDRLYACEEIVKRLHQWGSCYVVNEDGSYYWYGSTSKIPPEYKQWFTTDIGEL